MSWIFVKVRANFATCSACATANHALGEAWRTIKMGDASVMLAGGAEAAIVPIGIAGSEEILRDHSAPIPHFHRVVITIGEPIVPEARTSGVVARDKVDALTQRLSDSLQALLDQAYEARAT